MYIKKNRERKIETSNKKNRERKKKREVWWRGIYIYIQA